jgi:hypothetical protein
MSTSGAEVWCSGRGLFLAGVAVVSATGEDAQAGETTGLITGASGRTGDTGLSGCGAALELEACSRTRGALEKKDKLETTKERNRK